MDRVVVTNGVTYVWDEAKERANIAKHGLAFGEVTEAFSGRMLGRRDVRFDYGEDRWVGVGVIRGAVVVAIVHTDRKGVTRLISARRASRRERHEFEAPV